MKRFLDLVIIGSVTALVEAGSFKWNTNNGGRRWSPAHPTLGVMPLLGSNPVPTSPPNLAEARQNKRSATDNTCAYIGGDPHYPLYCSVDSLCVYNSVSSNIGCCPDTSTTCAIWTTCFDSTDASLYTTDNGYTLWCGDSEYPYCKTHLYNDDTFRGYTLQGCAVAAGTDSVVYSATLSSVSSSSRKSSSAANGFTTVSSSTRGSDPATSTLTTSTPTSRSSPAPIGAIVGGVVGGIAVIALFALGLVFLLRRRRRDPGPKGNQTAQQTSLSQSGGYPHQPPPSQPAMQHQYLQHSSQQPPLDPATGGFAAAPATYDRDSIQKPGFKYNVTHSMYDPSMTSPPDSPPSHGQHPASALPGYHVSTTSTSAVDRQHPGAHRYEMSTEPSDGELGELA
ncbi:hypothetical protein VPNG_10158 [Cytospora leucostoma]|uniref:Mid2 domain-containing protein n=1 Tax=Cytospora leucostoma TaxID=1230097 RepID=A0A423VES7_9PEZI|nr:hypothetical protein VPNG_10158 [Cytospora leucostoma]